MEHVKEKYQQGLGEHPACGTIQLFEERLRNGYISAEWTSLAVISD